jgi:hypothetical protein
MKCPKCGYNSFEFHDSCTKCSNDLTGFKNTYGLKPIVLPLEARTAMAASMRTEATELAADTVDTQNDMFSFDVPDDDAVSGGGSTLSSDDPFSFDDEPVSAAGGGGEFTFDDDQLSTPDNAADNAFSDLLESTSQQVDNPFVAPLSSPAPTASSPGEFDMNSFSWDDPSDTTAETASKPAEDDFTSLFGDNDAASK